MNESTAGEPAVNPPQPRTEKTGRPIEGGKPAYNIAIDASDLHRSGSARGLGRYARTLTEVLHDTNGITIRMVDPSPLTKKFGYRTLEWFEYPYRGFTLGTTDFDIFHATGVFNLALGAANRTVCSVQDIIQYDYPVDAKNKAKSRFFHAKLHKVRAILASSDYTKERIVSAFGVDAEKIFVAPLPIHIPDVTSHANTHIPAVLATRPYVVSLFDLTKPDPRKRLGLALQTAEQLKKFGIWLLLIGAGTEALSDDSNLRLGLGRVTDAEMAQIYRSAICYLYTTSYEGQGLPPQEAMAVGTPAVAMRNSSLPQMLGPGALFTDDSGRLADWPHNAAVDLAASVRALANDESYRQTLGEAGLRHVREFSVSRFRDAVLEAYRFSTP